MMPAVHPYEDNEVTGQMTAYTAGLLDVTNIVCLLRHLMLIPGRPTKCVSIADRDEHTAEIARVKIMLHGCFSSFKSWTSK